MSARAIRRLREERDEKQQEEDNSSTVDDDDDDHAGGGGGGAFAMMLDDDDSDSSSSSSDNDDETNDNVETKDKVVEDGVVNSSSVDNAEKKVTTQEEEETSKHIEAVASKDDEDKKEDVDALIEEFKEKDEKIGTASGDEIMDGDKKVAALQKGMFYEIVANLDPRDLDVEHVMRTSLLGSGGDYDDNNVEQSQQQQSRTRRNRQTFLFGTPRDDWVRPPHYVGGGIGMTTYDRENNKYTIPWPYTTSIINKQDWFHFVYADNIIHRDYADFQQIQQSGNVNALVLFVAHHPYLPEALLQLAMMLYQINRSQEGLMFLKRCLWVYECGSIKNFTPHFATCFMDYHTLENSTYFLALFRLAQVNNMAGMPRASFATSRYLLSLDPLRDPTGILLALDHYALACNITTYDQWLVNLVECQKIKIYYHDDEESENYYNQSTNTTTETSTTTSNNDEDCCDLLELPNWAYSYALALFRLQQQQQDQSSDDNDSNINTKKANQFLQLAMSRFPTVVELLLQANDVDTTTGRSFRMDWPSVIGYISIRSNYLEQLWSETCQQDTVVRVATLQASELVIRIFVQQNHKLWAGNDIQQWLFDNLQELHKNNYIMNNNNLTADVTSTTDNYSNNNKPLSPCIRRYGISDPSDYQNRFDLLPPEANPLDPGLLAHAMAVDPNRRRFLRGQQQQRGPAADNFFDEINALQQQQQGMTLLGPPTNNIDPDWPILEILWRSLLPWNRVEGVPRPRR